MSTESFLIPFTEEEFNETGRFFSDIYGNTAAKICTAFDANIVMTVKAALYGPRGYGFRNGARTDAMLSPNSLSDYGPRSKSNVGMLNCLFMDLDIPENRYMYIEEAVSDVEDALAKVGIKASYIINSGSQFGLHIYIIFANKMKKTDQTVILWEKLQNALKTALEELCPDRSVVSDYARILRVPNSVNGKHGTRVKIIKNNKVKYTVEELKKLLLNETPGSELPPTEAQLKRIKEIEEIKGVKFPEAYYKNRKNASLTIKNNKDIKPEITDRQIDYIRKICSKQDMDTNSILMNLHSKGEAWQWIQQKQILKHEKKISRVKTEWDQPIEGWIVDCIERFIRDNPDNRYRRETLLFITRLALIHLYGGDYKRAAEKVCELNKLFIDPFLQDEILKLTKSAEKTYEQQPDKYYCPASIDEKIYNGGDHILPYFYLTGKRKTNKVDKARDPEYQREYYERRLESAGKTTKKKDLQIKTAEIIKIVADNPDLKKIEIIRMVAAKYDVSERTARRYYEACNIERENPAETSVQKIHDTGKRTVTAGLSQKALKNDKISNSLLLNNASGIRGVSRKLAFVLSLFEDQDTSERIIEKEYYCLAYAIPETAYYFLIPSTSLYLRNHEGRGLIRAP